MAKDDPRDRDRSEPPEIADAEGLFQDDMGAKRKPMPTPAAGAASDPGETFALADSPSSVDLGPPARVLPDPLVSARASGRPPQPGKSETSTNQPTLEASALVEEVWSRQAEWGPTLVVVGAWVTFVLLFVAFCLGTGLIGTALLTVLGGGMVAVVLSYPILITLERPVRLTPEQALHDYYGALSHHLPHFRRMWLLLSTAGKTSTPYTSFDGFKAYWKDRLATMRPEHAGPLSPLDFEVTELNADKSMGKARVDVRFTLKVSVRGQSHAGAVNAIPMAIALVRGPDRMWYLEDGTLGQEGQTS